MALAGVDGVDETRRARRQALEHAPRVVEAAGPFHVGDGVALDLVVAAALLEDVEQLQVGRVGPDAVDDGEGELPLGQILAETFVLRVLGRRQVHVVVPDLEDQSDQVRERDAVPVEKLSLDFLVWSKRISKRW